jgi:hypothetical protein
LHDASVVGGPRHTQELLDAAVAQVKHVLASSFTTIRVL